MDHVNDLDDLLNEMADVLDTKTTVKIDKP